MKHFALILFAASALAQRPRIETDLQIFDRPNSTVRLQRLSGGTHQIFDSTGATRTTATAGRLDLSARDLSSVVRERVSLRSSSTAGSIYLSAFDGVSGTEKITVFIGFGEVSAQSLTLSDEIVSPSRQRRFTVPTTGAAFINWYLPENDGSPGDCFKRGPNGFGGIGKFEFGACDAAGGFVTLTTDQFDITGEKRFRNIVTFKKDTNNVLIYGRDASDNVRFEMSAYSPTAGAAGATQIALYTGIGPRGVNILADQSSQNGFLIATHIGAAVAAQPFARGFTYPGGPVGVVNGGYYWSMPSSDANGPICSNGSGVLSINTCGSLPANVVTTDTAGQDIIAVKDFVGATSSSSLIRLYNGALLYGEIRPADIFLSNGVKSVEMDGINGVFKANSWTGINLNCAPGEYLHAPRVEGGIIVAGNCLP